jgi:hypothetical protein
MREARVQYKKEKAAKAKETADKVLAEIPALQSKAAQRAAKYKKRSVAQHDVLDIVSPRKCFASTGVERWVGCTA